MRNKLILLLFTSMFPAKIFADTTYVAADSSVKPFVPTNKGPLGIDNMTGMALYGIAILFAILILALWRQNIMKKNG